MPAFPLPARLRRQLARAPHKEAAGKAPHKKAAGKGASHVLTAGRRLSMRVPSMDCSSPAEGTTAALVNAGAA